MKPANVALLAVSVVVGIGLFELGVRAAGLDYNLSPNWKFHPVLGWSQVPNGSYDVVIEGHPVHVTFNSMGFRDGEHQRPKPRGVRRIVVIGDSFSEAVQVNLEETFHQVLEGLLNRDSSTTWEVINLGVGDFGTAQEYIALTEYGLPFEPDLVIHQIFPLNDICNNSIRLYGLCRSQNDLFRPYFVEREGTLRQTYAQPLLTFLRHHTASYNTVEYWALKLVGWNPQDPDDPGRPRRLRASGFNRLDPLLYTYVDQARLPDQVEHAWRMTERLIERIVQVSRERGIAYLGMVVPFELTLQPAWAQFAAAQPAPPLDAHYPEERLGAHFARLGVESVMVADAFRPHLVEVLPFVGGHFSVAGHRRAAEALYRAMVQQELVPSPRAGDQRARARSSR